MSRTRTAPLMLALLAAAVSAGCAGVAAESVTPTTPSSPRPPTAQQWASTVCGPFRDVLVSHAAVLAGLRSALEDGDEPVALKGSVSSTIAALKDLGAAFDDPGPDVENAAEVIAAVQADLPAVSSAYASFETEVGTLDPSGPGYADDLAAAARRYESLAADVSSLLSDIQTADPAGAVADVLGTDSACASFASAE